MKLFLLRRLALAVATAWLVTSTAFLLSHTFLTSGSRLASDELLLSQQERRQQAGNEQRIASRLGLQQPLFYCSLMPLRWHGTPNRYHTWLTGLLQGRLGQSYRDGAPVAGQLATALRVTVPLMLGALALAGSVALVGAMALARRARLRAAVVPWLYTLDSVPLFAVGLLLIFLFANPDHLLWFPAYGLGPEPGPDASAVAVLAQQAYHLLLPALSLALISVPTMLLPTVAVLQQQRRQPYATTALAKGLPAASVWWRHILPNALPVFITRLTDLLPGLVAGAVVIEVLFSLPGMGRLLAEAAAARDFPTLTGGILVTATFRLVAWLLADVAQAFIDPRIALK